MNKRLWLQMGILASGLFFISQNVYATAFPQVRQTSDLDDMLVVYAPYLNFALEVGNQVDRANAQKLAQVYAKLKKSYPEGAARFLKGLRFEMVSKFETTTVSADRLSTSSPEMRQFVRSYIKWWAREADEHLLRSYSNAIARR